MEKSYFYCVHLIEKKVGYCQNWSLFRMENEDFFFIVPFVKEWRAPNCESDMNLFKWRFMRSSFKIRKKWWAGTVLVKLLKSSLDLQSSNFLRCIFFKLRFFFINFKHIQIFAFCHINQYTNETADFRKRYNRKNPLKIKLKPKDTCFWIFCQSIKKN